MELKAFLEKLIQMSIDNPELLDLPVIIHTGSPIESVERYDRYMIPSGEVIISGIKLTYADYE